jgi:hypothetical protein
MARSLQKEEALGPCAELSVMIFYLFVEASRVELNLALVESRILTLTKKLTKDEPRPRKNRIIQV